MAVKPKRSAPKRMKLELPQVTRTRGILVAWTAFSATLAAVVLLWVYMIFRNDSLCRSKDPAVAINGCSLILDAFVLLDGRRVLALDHRAQAYLAANLPDQALADWSAALVIRPANPVLWLGRGRAYQRAGQFDLAIRDFNKAIVLQPDFIDARLARGAAFADKSLFEEAIGDYSNVLEHWPQDAATWRARPDFRSRRRHRSGAAGL